MIPAHNHSEQQTEQREGETDKQKEHTFLELGDRRDFHQRARSNGKNWHFRDIDIIHLYLQSCVFLTKSFLEIFSDSSNAVIIYE